MANQPPQGWDVKTSVVIPAKQSPTRVDLNPDDFNTLLQQKGIRVRVFRSMFCSNVKSVDGGEHNIDCPICNGNNFIDARPIDTVAFIQNQALETLPQVEGLIDGNSVAMTFPTGIELNYFTLVELCDFQQPFFQRVKRQQGRVDLLKYRAHRINLLIDQNGAEYFPDVDFLLDDNGSVLWLDNRGPDPDTIYSIHYNSSVQFRAVRAMHANRYTQYVSGGSSTAVKMPEQWMMSKEFLVERKDRYGQQLLPNLITPKQDAEEPEDPYER